MKGNGGGGPSLQGWSEEEDLYIEKPSVRDGWWMNEWRKRNKKRRLCICERSRAWQKRKKEWNTTSEILRLNEISLFVFSFWTLILLRQSFSIHLFPSCVYWDTYRMLPRNIFMSRWSKEASQVKYIIRTRSVGYFGSFAKGNERWRNTATAAAPPRQPARLMVMVVWIVVIVVFGHIPFSPWVA